MNYSRRFELEGSAAILGVYDMFPWFQGESVREITNSIVDTHPNAEGHRLIAEGMLEALTAMGLIALPTNEAAIL